MVNSCGVAVVGAGPYGLSLAAHLRKRGVDFRIFGKPLDTWRRHMPEEMFLKSDGFASNLSAPAPDSTLAAYCAKHGLPYHDQGLPVPLSRFLAYAEDFRTRFVPNLEETNVAGIERAGHGFALTLEDDERLIARHVVLAVGIARYAYTPPILRSLPPEALSHSFDHRAFGRFRGKDVAVIGAGASAVDIADALFEAGASPRVVARAEAIRFNPVPHKDAETFLYRLLRPASGIGRGWRSYFCAAAPLLFYRLPRHLKDRAIASHMHPAGGWFMRERVEGKILTLSGRTISDAAMKDGQAVLALTAADGTEEKFSFDHIIAATGFRPDLRRLPFLARDLAETAAPGGGPPELSDRFETHVPGLYALGLTAMESFGPLMRFMVGAEFACPRLAAHLGRKRESGNSRRAANTIIPAGASRLHPRCAPLRLSARTSPKE